MTSTSARAASNSIRSLAAVSTKGLKWLVAAELAETTRLYARTLAKIDPDWIEAAAGDVVTRNYF